LRRPLIAGNWKMYKTTKEARDYIDRLGVLLLNEMVEVAILAPFTSLPLFKENRHRSRIRYGAQNMFGAREGAFTGEISPLMLVDLDCDYVIIGHSERRQIMKESDQIINEKIKLALEHALTPILCVGETLEEREAGRAAEVVGRQLSLGLHEVLPSRELVIAYEPVWAIGTGVNATASDAQDMISFIRSSLRQLWGPEQADRTRILYGGSVKPNNIGELMRQNDIDGALVGGASLDPHVFAEIINYR